MAAMAADGEEAESSAAAGRGQRAPFARGGPVFVPFMVGPMSTAPGFMSSALHELQSLEAELGDSVDELDDELSVDELKVLSEEELVERALQEAMEEDWDSGALQLTEEQTSDGGASENTIPIDQAPTSSLSAERESSGSPTEDIAIEPHESLGCNRETRGKKARIRDRKGKDGTTGLDSSVEKESHELPTETSDVPYEPQNSSAVNQMPETPADGMSIVPHDTEGTNELTKCRKGKKRGRHFDREVRAKVLYGSYLTKAVKMAEIKAKQDEDKRAARLHSFSGNSANSKGSKSSEKIEMAKTLNYVSAPWKKKASISEEHRPVAHPEVILCVEVYEKRYASVKSQEFLVLGSQFLTDLRDNIYCLTDKLMNRAGQHDHSGYFLIEDTFYNDTRHYSSSDYSKPILDWLQNSSEEASEKWDAITSGVLKKRQKDLLRGLNISNVPEFKSEKMQRIRFSDLQFRLGAGYLYCHQGNCKHMIVIRDMRLIHPDDTHNQADYPLMTFQLQRRLQKCSVCQIFPATKMTVDDKWALNNPCYFCIKCYYLLHYKEDGSLFYHHTVYDYIQE
ncbi:hypothetical protein EJB05_18013 [Eragrostis curvula]|uniref:snRNA-activating protein complex subunit n=1 Tax=Eragrostis curvula TaxID=38414 RepID=A0A5J9VKJ9_9POAL|nr:hypothetical protein EJB05_18013 [Eragrostis curvula]